MKHFNLENKYIKNMVQKNQKLDKSIFKSITFQYF